MDGGNSTERIRNQIMVDEKEEAATVREITDAEWKKQVLYLQSIVVMKRDYWEQHKANTKAAKEQYDEAVDNLIQASGESDLPLFDTE
jgi:hypothetical protein